MGRSGKARALVMVIVGVFTALCISGCASATYSFESLENVRAETIEVDAFTGIDIDLAVSNVVVKPGDTYAVSIKKTKNYPDIACEVTSGTLVITDGSMRDNVTNAYSEVVITVPADADLQNFKLLVEVGDVKVSEIDMVDADCDTSVGEMLFRNVSAQTMTLRSEVGNITVESLEGARDAQMDLSTDAGEITVNEKSVGSRYEQEGASPVLHASVDVGNISVS